MSNHAVEPPLSRVRSLLRGIAAVIGRWALGEPVAIVPRRDADRLEYLSRRERIWEAARTGDEAYLERELARLQPTAEELRRSAVHNTPIEDWPDEDLEAMFGPEIVERINKAHRIASGRAAVSQQQHQGGELG